MLSLPVLVVVVTFNSASHVRALAEGIDAAFEGFANFRVVVVDNASEDETLHLVDKYLSCSVIHTGGNPGYAAAINCALRGRRPDEAVLILNPDLVLNGGTVKNLLLGMTPESLAIHVPKLLRPNDETYFSLFRWPSVSRAFGEAVLGGTRAGKFRLLCENITRGADYESDHPVSWAQGAALLVSPRAASRLGEWDERYFLYSEETEYFRRAWEANVPVKFIAPATAHHTAGGSGSVPWMRALLHINRVHYFSTRHTRFTTWVFALCVALGELVRFRQPTAQKSLRALARPAFWERNRIYTGEQIAEMLRR